MELSPVHSKLLIVPIVKGGDSTCASKYRPMSLWSIISKILEKCVNERLYAYLDEYNFWFSGQFGFRRGSNTAVDLVTKILNKRDKGLGAYLSHWI